MKNWSGLKLYKNQHLSALKVNYESTKMAHSQLDKIYNEALIAQPIKIRFQDSDSAGFSDIKKMVRFIIHEKTNWKDYDFILNQLSQADDLINYYQSKQTDINQITNKFSTVRSMFDYYFPYNSNAGKYYRIAFSIGGKDLGRAFNAWLVGTSNTNPKLRHDIVAQVLASQYLSNYKLDEIKENNLLFFENLKSHYSTVYQEAIEIIETHRERGEELKNKITVLESEYSNYQIQAKSDLEKLIIEKNLKLEELERLYQEKLRLSAPAKMWEEVAEKYERLSSGNFKSIIISSIGFISLILIVIALSLIYYNENWEKLRYPLIIAGSLIVTVFSLFIITQIKIYMSNVHLSRDAAERKELVFLYLSLIEKSASSTEDRSIILQSLFSRSDTGLIKSDGVTMPGIPGFVKEIFGSK